MSQPVSFKRRGKIITKTKQNKKIHLEFKTGSRWEKQELRESLTHSQKKNNTNNKKNQTPTISASQLKRAHALSATQTAQSEIIPWHFPPKCLKGFRARTRALRSRTGSSEGRIGLIPEQKCSAVIFPHRLAVIRPRFNEIRHTHHPPSPRSSIFRLCRHEYKLRQHPQEGTASSKACLSSNYTVRLNERWELPTVCLQTLPPERFHTHRVTIPHQHRTQTAAQIPRRKEEGQTHTSLLTNGLLSKQTRQTEGGAGMRIKCGCFEMPRQFFVLVMKQMGLRL